MADYATLLRDHVTLSCRSVDRIFLQAYVPKLQYVGGVCQFLYWQRGYAIPSSAAFGKIGDGYVAEVHRWAKANGIVVRRFVKGENKEASARLRDGAAPPGPLAMIWAAASAFRFRFVVCKGYHDGVAGLVLSVLFAFYRFEVEAKTWEAAGYGRDGDSTVRRLRSLPRLVAALGGHGVRRLWSRRGAA